MRMQLKGSAEFMACVDGEVRLLKLREVYHAKNFPWNIKYEHIDEMGCELRYDEQKCRVVRRSDGCKVFGVHKDTNNKVVVRIV